MRTGQPLSLCPCGAAATQTDTCRICLARFGLPMLHCKNCMHYCPGNLSSGEKCVTDRNTARQCHSCKHAACEEVECDEFRNLEECSICSRLFCDREDCTITCEGCGEVVCSDCVGVECETHPGLYCKNCVTDCNFCGEKCCQECVCVDAFCGSAVCPGCSEAACYICDGILCEDDAIECSSCDNYVCREHSKKCMLVEDGVRCENTICKDCGLHSCDLCSVSGCKDHFNHCDTCDITYCGDHVEKCSKCRKTYHDGCEKHLCGEEPSISSELSKGPDFALRMNQRVKSKTGLFGTVVHISTKGPVTKYIVEWDDDTVGKYSKEELQSPNPRRRKHS